MPIGWDSASIKRTVAADKASDPKDKATSSKVSSSSKQKVSHATWKLQEILKKYFIINMNNYR